MRRVYNSISFNFVSPERKWCHIAKLIPDCYFQAQSHCRSWRYQRQQKERGHQTGVMWRKRKAGNGQSVKCENCWFLHTDVRCTSAPQKWLSVCRRHRSLEGVGFLLLPCTIFRTLSLSASIKKFCCVLITSPIVVLLKLSWLNYIWIPIWEFIDQIPCVPTSFLYRKSNIQKTHPFSGLLGYMKNLEKHFPHFCRVNITTKGKKKKLMCKHVGSSM